jgi:hypothetical protein
MEEDIWSRLSASYARPFSMKESSMSFLSGAEPSFSFMAKRFVTMSFAILELFSM